MWGVILYLYRNIDPEMASVDGSKSLQGASDEMFAKVCGPCKEDNIEEGANEFCVDCGVYRCNLCKEFHRKLSICKNHKIVFGSQNLTAVSPVSQRSGLGLYCGCNTNVEVEFYCKKHKDIMCGSCRSIKHHKCKTVSVQEKSSSYTTQMINSLMLKTKSMKDKFYKMKKESTESINELNISKEACKKEIQTFRKELNAFLDKLENDMLKKLDKSEKEQHKQLNQHISTLTAALQMLDSDYILLENAKQDGRKPVMFTSGPGCSKLRMSLVNVSLKFQTLIS